MRPFQIIFHTIFSIFSLLVLIYVLPKTPEFPNHLPDAVQSLELADTETPWRRGYYTNFNREQVVEYYNSQFGNVNILGYLVPTVRLSHPHENSFTLIRDQTKSSYIEELAHPFRESIYINGFLPSLEKDDIWYKGVHYSHKITIRYAPSNLTVRLIFSIFTLLFLYYILFFASREFKRFLKSLFVLATLK